MSSTLATPATTSPNALAATWAPRVLSVLRIVVALLFIEHGTQKLFSFPAAPSFPNPASFSLVWFAAVLEVFGGALVAVGLATRPVAFLLSGEMAIGYWMAHAPKNVFPALNGGEGAILYCFAFLYLAVAGGGAWSLDRARGSD